MAVGGAEPSNGAMRHLSMLAAWGLSFGYAVGWGAFVMPGFKIPCSLIRSNH